MANSDAVDERYHHFASHVEGLLAHLEAEAPLRGTVEWSFLSHIRHLSQSIASSTSFKGLEGSLASLSRFSVDSMPWEGPVWRRYNELIAIVPSKYEQRVGAK